MVWLLNYVVVAIQTILLLQKKNKIYLSSAFYLKNITGFIVNDTIFTGSAGYGIVMINVVNTVYYKTQVEASIPASFTSTLSLKYGGRIILISSAGELSDYNSITFMNCSFSVLIKVFQIVLKSIQVVTSN